MGAMGFLVSLVLFGLNLFGTLRLERHLTSSFDFELAFIVVFGILSLLTLLGILLERRWAWPMFVLLFSASLGNLFLLFRDLGGSVSIAATLLVNVLALVMGLLALDADADLPSAPMPLETYTPPEPLPAVEPVYDTLPATAALAARRKRAAKKKKSGKKKPRKRKR